VSFGAKQSKAQLEEHREARHSKLTFEKCFPTWGQAPAAAAAPAPAAADAKKKKKKGRGRR